MFKALTIAYQSVCAALVLATVALLSYVAFYPLYVLVIGY